MVSAAGLGRWVVPANRQSKLTIATTAFPSMVLAVYLLTCTQSLAQECDAKDSIFAKPPVGVDAIVVAVSGGRPGFKVLASIDSTGRALLLRDANHPEITRVALLGSGLCDRLVARAYRAAEADGAQAESYRGDTTTLEGLLDAVRRGETGCQAHLEGVDRDVMLYVAGDETRCVCVGGELSEFNRHVVEVVSDAADAAGSIGELLCPQ